LCFFPGRKVYFVLWHNGAVTGGARHARHRAQPLSDPRQQPRAHQGFLLQGARIRSDAASGFSVPRLLARRQRQDPGPHGTGRRAELQALLPRQPEERRDEQLGGDRSHRVPRERSRPVRRAPQRSRRSRAAAQLPRVRSLSALPQGPGRPHHRAQLLRRDQGAGLGGRGRREDASRGKEDEGEGQGARVTAPHQPVSFAGVSYDEAIARARALVPALRERAKAAEAARTMSEETIADLHASGVIRSMQPKRWGGMEFDYVAYVDFPLELSRGDASVGWNLANLQIHHWMLGLYDERAQEEVWGENRDALIASGIA